MIINILYDIGNILCTLNTVVKKINSVKSNVTEGAPS